MFDTLVDESNSFASITVYKVRPIFTIKFSFAMLRITNWQWNTYLCPTFISTNIGMINCKLFNCNRNINWKKMYARIEKLVPMWTCGYTSWYNEVILLEYTIFLKSSKTIDMKLTLNHRKNKMWKMLNRDHIIIY